MPALRPGAWSCCPTDSDADNADTGNNARSNSHKKRRIHGVFYGCLFLRAYIGTAPWPALSGGATAMKADLTVRRLNQASFNVAEMRNARRYGLA